MALRRIKDFPDERQKMKEERAAGTQTGMIYVHLPFCVRKCRYCDFLSGSAYEIKPYLAALKRECLSLPASVRQWQISSVYFGGGTPSLLSPEEWEELGALLQDVFQIPAQAEISAEANPGTLSPEKLAVMRRVGINRLSLGLQSAQQEELELLGRIHTFEEFLISYQQAREAGFSNLNVDVMSGLPGQTKERFLDTLAKVTALSPTHISAYSLIVEPGTPFYDQYGDGAGLPSEEEEREMYWEGCAFLEAAGYLAYEISNFAKPGYCCRHNLGYWTGVPYVGLGLGAASYYDGRRLKNTSDMATYLKEAECPEKRIAEDIPIGQKEAMEEFMFLGLRLRRGVKEARFAQRFGIAMDEVYGSVIRRLLDEGLLQKEGGHLFLTPRGIDISNWVLADFLLE